MRPASFLLPLVLGYCSCRQSQPDAPVVYGDNAAAGHYLNTRGLKMYYETYGEGDPLLLLHINGGSIANFANQIPYRHPRTRQIGGSGGLPDIRNDG